MDGSLDVVYGPHPIQKSGTITIPTDLLHELGLVRGEDRAHWALNPDIPGTLVLIPSKMMARATPDLLERLRHLAT